MAQVAEQFAQQAGPGAEPSLLGLLKCSTFSGHLVPFGVTPNEEYVASQI